MIQKNKKAQVWVETVIYILISVSLIGLVLAFALPKINEQKDKIVLQRTIDLMTELENNIRDIKISGTSATKENIIKLNYGQLTINPSDDILSFVLEESSYAIGKPREDNPIVVNPYPGTGIVARTELKGKKYKVIITLNFKGKYNILYDNSDTSVRVLTPQPSPHRLMVENKGKDDPSELTKINFYLNS